MPAHAPRRMFVESVDDDWRDDAQCRGELELMFSGEHGDIAAAKALCASCPVTERCLDTAIANREQFGVWGGVLFYNGVAKRLERERQRAS